MEDCAECLRKNGHCKMERMPKWEHVLWKILVPGGSLSAFTTRRAAFFNAISMFRCPQKYSYFQDTFWGWLRYTVRVSLRSHKHDIERGAGLL